MNICYVSTFTCIVLDNKGSKSITDIWVIIITAAYTPCMIFILDNTIKNWWLIKLKCHNQLCNGFILYLNDCNV